MRLSVIVPVYNVESYLCKCIDSLLDQDLDKDEYEIIIVDDGSSDQSGVMCNEYASCYTCVNVLHQSNRGLSAARNSGIYVAQGEYVMFVDSDDYIESNVLRTIVEKAETEGLDVLRYNYRNVNYRYEVFEPNKVSKPFVDYRDEPCDGLEFLNERLGFGCYACQFLVKRELLNNCLFVEGIFFEDTEWTPRMLRKARRVTSINLMVYNYLMREGSITQSVDDRKRRKVLEDKFQLIDSMQKQMMEVEDKRWYKGMITQIVLSIISYVSIHYYENKASVMKELESKEVFPLSSYHSTSAAIVKIQLANMSPSLLCWLIHCRINYMN